MSRIFTWALNAVYLAVLLVASPWILWSAFKHGKYREGFGAKFLGRVPVRHGSESCVWLHAVSVGEVNLLASTITELERGLPAVEVVISTTTKAGHDLACRKYPAHTVFYCPLDFSWATRAAIRRVRPEMLVLAELELWPNLIGAAKDFGARVAIINGRLSDKSFRGYHRLRWITRPVLSMIDLIAAQNEETAARFVQLGARRNSVHATGSLKFDGAQTDRENQRTTELSTLAGFESGDVVLLAGSTQEPEEQIAINIYHALVKDFPQLKLVLAPRHPQRFEEVASLLSRTSCRWVRRTQLGQSESQRRSPGIILVDTIGELGAWWGTATVGFVGGSFGSRGGQNMLEPAAYGVATCFGPNTWNFRDIVGQLLRAEGAVVVRSEQEFAAFVRQVLENRQWAQALGDRARRLVVSQQGATARTVELLLPLAGGSPAQSCAA